MTPLMMLWLIVSFLIIIIYYNIFLRNLRHVSRPPEDIFTPKSIDRMREHPIFSNAVLSTNLYENGFFDDSFEACPDKTKPLKLLIAVISEAHKKTSRMGIRKTWGHYDLRYDVCIVFIHGGDIKEPTYESETFGDVLVSKNGDQKYNEGLKTMALMEFVMKSPSVEFVLKTTDKIYVNVPAVLKTIGKLSKTSRKIYGSLRTGETTSRDTRSSRYIPKIQYNSPVLPDYLNGDAYLFPGFLARELLVEALNMVFIPVEDIFITGMVARNAGISIVNQSEFNVPKDIYDTSSFGFFDVAYSYANLVATQYKLWTDMNELCEENDVFV